MGSRLTDSQWSRPDESNGHMECWIGVHECVNPGCSADELPIMDMCLLASLLAPLSPEISPACRGWNRSSRLHVHNAGAECH